MTGTRVLVVDDEPQFLRALQTNLRGAGYDVVAATTAEEALSAAALQPPDAVILDLLLPDGRGTDVCRELRRWTDVPIIVVSAVGEEAEKIAALDAGADDYVTKPFAIGELLARLRAALRRVGPATEPVLEIGELVLDLEKRSVAMAGEPVHLTPHEFELLRVLAQNEGKLLTHKTILREVWGPAYQRESSYLHVFVSQLRRKLEPDPARPRYILTEPGAGYRLVNPERERLEDILRARREALDHPQTAGPTSGHDRISSNEPAAGDGHMWFRTLGRGLKGLKARRALRAARWAADAELLRRESPPLRLAWRVEELVTPKNRLDSRTRFARSSGSRVPGTFRAHPRSTASPSGPRPRLCSQWQRALPISRGRLPRAASFSSSACSSTAPARSTIAS